MKKLFLSFCFVLMLLFSISCSYTVILNSEEAELRMTEKGYKTTIVVHYGDTAKNFNVQQVTIFDATMDNDFIQVYYFTNEEDTETFYKDRAASLSSGVDVVRKNKYSIYRGTEKAVEDFLQQ